MSKLNALRVVARAVFAAGLGLLAASAAQAATEVNLSYVPGGGGTQTARSFTFTDTSTGSTITSTVTAYDLRVDDGVGNGSTGITSTFGTFNGTIGSELLEICAIPAGPTVNCTGTADNTDLSGNDANQLNISPSFGLGLDGTQASNFIGYGEVLQIQFDTEISNIGELTIFEKGDAEKIAYIFDSTFAFRGAINVNEFTGNSSLQESTFTTFSNGDFLTGDFTTGHTGAVDGNGFGGTFYLVGNDIAGNANDAFTLSAIRINAVPVPPAVWMMSAAFGLFGFFGYRRRRRAA